MQSKRLNDIVAEATESCMSDTFDIYRIDMDLGTPKSIDHNYKFALSVGKVDNLAN